MQLDDINTQRITLSSKRYELSLKSASTPKLINKHRPDTSMAPGSISETVQLRNSVQIPRLGFGVYKSPPDLCVQSCLYALRCGYRHIDTAQFYANESQVGAALQKSGLPRSAVFLTTKILSAAGTVETSYQQCLGSLDKLDPVNHYVDLFLIHSPNSGAEKRKEMWLALEKLYKEGKARSIGVSNFGIQHIEEMKQYAEVWPPQVNQIEVVKPTPQLRSLLM